MSDELRRLKWGETPWDNLTREQLLQEVQRMHMALLGAHSELKIQAMSNPSHPYWADIRGSGARTLAKVGIALERSEATKCDREDVYRKFFRYAIDLLFTPEIGFGWWICDKCQTMVGANPDGNRNSTTCYEPKCDAAPLRPITWDDLKPLATEE